MRSPSILAWVVAAGLGLAHLLGCSREEPPTVDRTREALELLNQKCTVCHTAERFEARDFTPEQWNEVLDRMLKKGAKLSGDQLDVLRYLKRDR